MSSEWNQVGFFAAGLAIGAVATAMIVLGPYSPVRKKAEARPAAVQPTAAAYRGADCPLEPAATAAGLKDGRYRMPADLAGYAATDFNAFIVMGNEAAAAGRPHDAEIAYLMACRVAERFKGAGSLAAADARFELARHYGNLANAAGPASPDCGELLRRAEMMYSDSLHLYRASYGAGHDKVRQAEQGLVSVRQILMAQAGIVPGAAAAQPTTDAAAAPVAPRAAPNEARDDAVVRPEPPAARPRPTAVAKPQPRAVQAAQPKQAAARKVVMNRSRVAESCPGARTRTEKLICSDAELARLDREVDYLRARARNAALYEREWQQREAMCRDRACLRQVIANKRSQLLADINSA